MTAELVCIAEVAVMVVVAVVLALRLQGATRLYRAMLLAVPLCQAVALGLYFAAIIADGLSMSLVAYGLGLGVACIAANGVSFAVLSAAAKRDESQDKLRLLGEERTALAAQAQQLEAQREEARLIYEQAAVELERALEALGAGVAEAGEQSAAGEHLRRSTELVDSTARRACKNNVVAALVDMKTSAAHEAGIKVSRELSVPESLPFSGVELTAVFANLFDNAINACAAVKPGARHIYLQAFTRGAFFVVQMRNSCVASEGDLPALTLSGPTAKTAVEPTPPEREGTQALDSSLPRHGWGLSIISNVAAAHGGFVETSIEDLDDACEFCAVVALGMGKCSGGGRLLRSKHAV